MNRKAAFVAAAAFVLLAADIQAQSGSRSSYSNFQNQAIRRQSIGAGYTSQQLIAQTLNSSVAAAPRTGVASVDTTSGFRSSSSFGTRSLAGPAQRPFSTIQRRPSVSPFLGLFQETFDEDANAFAFQTLVRPQLQQRRAQQQQQVADQRARSEQIQFYQQLQQLAAQPNLNPAGAQNVIPTGVSPGAFRFYSHWYPSAR